MTAVLHYIFDPFCGWCYGAAPLLEAARATRIPIELHGGGMMAGANRQRVTAQLRAFINTHDQRIAALSGQVFGDAYRNGLLNDSSAILDSGPPTTAILAAEAQDHRGLDMLKRLQQAHFIEGRRIADQAVLEEMAGSLGLDRAVFAERFAALAGDATQAHIAASRALLQQVGGQGFPTFILARGNRMRMLDFGQWLGLPSEWQRALEKELAAQA